MHDLGEITCGDTHYKEKDGSEEKCEYLSFRRLVSQMPVDLQKQLIDQYSIQFDTESRAMLKIKQQGKNNGNQLLYEFIEKIGYIFFAVREYEQNQETLPLLLQVLRNQLEHIENLLTKIPQMKRLVTDDFLLWAKELLKEHKDKYLEE
jgi:hypothetical protein